MFRVVKRWIVDAAAWVDGRPWCWFVWGVVNGALPFLLSPPWLAVWALILVSVAWASLLIVGQDWGE